ncbi:unnamed protein product, partial [marine sediment metagenome]
AGEANEVLNSKTKGGVRNEYKGKDSFAYAAFC